MEPATIATRLASSAVTPIVRKLFVREGTGAGLVDKPVRISSLVSFKGEQRTLSERQLGKLADELTDRAAQAAGPHEVPDDRTRHELTSALTTALHSIGDLEMDDVQAVRLGPAGLARQLDRPRHLSATAEAHFGPLLHAACLHILNFFSQRSTFIPRTLTEQTHALDRAVCVRDLLLERVPARSAEDARFEQAYAEHIARKHGELTIHGLDFNHTRDWRLDSAYISLEATQDAGESLATATPVSADRVLTDQDRVLLRGPAGSGKTTLLQWLAVTAARQTYDEHLAHLLGRVPFVLPLRRVVRDGMPPAPDRFLHAVRSSLADAQPPGWAERVLTAKRGLLLIDGIDEVPAGQREDIRRWLGELAGNFPGNLCLVTSRPSAVREDWLAADGFKELSLAPMSRHDAAAFITRWHNAADAEPGLADTLIAAVRTNPDLGRLAGNPLMCGLLCALHRERPCCLPYGRRDLYDASLSMLLERRDPDRSAPVPDGLRLSKDSQIQLLQRLAHWMILNGRAEMGRADVIAQLKLPAGQSARIDATPHELLRQLLDRSGLLREPAEGRVEFVHRTFQDYLGAKAAVEEGDFPLLLDNAHKDQWEDVIRMAVAHARPLEGARLLRGLVEQVPADGTGGGLSPQEGGEEGEFRSDVRNLLLAAACLENATDLHPHVRAEVTAKTSLLLPPRSMAAARHVADIGGPTLLGLLPGPEGLTDHEAACAAVAASRTGTDAALPVLARFRHHRSLDLRRQLVWAWHRFDTDEYASEIIAHLEESGLYFTAHHIGHLRALRRMGGRARIQIIGRYHPNQLVEHVDPDRLTHLWLRDGYARHNGDEWLRSFPNLRTLVVPGSTPRYMTATLPDHLTVVTESELAGRS